jgi:hypothetical protein
MICERLVEHTRHIPQPVGEPGNVSKNHLPAILSGIVFSLSVSVGSAEDSADKGRIDAKSFRCLTEMTHVRQFYVDNVLGNLDATLAVANSATGGSYPPGAVIQLVPTEAMVKRDKGFNPVTLKAAKTRGVRSPCLPRHHDFRRPQSQDNQVRGS